MAKLSIKDLDLKDKRVFIRVDFNVPLRAGGQEISSDKRIRASLPTIQYAIEHCAAVILASHLGRPKGKWKPELSLAPVAARLSELLGKPVAMAPDCVGPETAEMKPSPGEILLLENLRFHPGEEANDPRSVERVVGKASGHGARLRGTRNGRDETQSGRNTVIGEPPLSPWRRSKRPEIG